MKLDFNLQVTQKQGIALTAQVQQAIKLLHMTNMEIQEYVDDQFQDNPFIETTGEFGENKDDSADLMLEDEFIGVVLQDDEDGEVCFHVQISILEEDLDEV